MEKSEKFRLSYSIFLGIFTVAVGIAVICVAADIYYSGKDTGVIYTREIVSDKLTALAIPLILLIGAIIFGAIFPLYRVKASRPPEHTLAKLTPRIPSSGTGEDFSAAQAAYKKAAVIRLAAWLVALAAVLASSIAMLCYLVDTAHFADDITEDIFAMAANMLPWIAVAFAACIAATVVSAVFANKQITAAKTMIKSGDKSSVTQKSPPKFIAVIKSIIDKPMFVTAERCAIFVIALSFIIAGIVNGGARDVLIKAVNICTECIGLG